MPVDKPKDILFNNNFLLVNGKTGPIFNSQRELALLITADKDFSYNNLDSLLSFLSQGLKAKTEANSKPISVNLKRAIIDHAAQRVKDKEYFIKIIEDSFKYWKGDGLPSTNDGKQDGSFKTAIDNFVDSRYIIIIAPTAIPNPDWDSKETTLTTYLYVDLYYRILKKGATVSYFFTDIASLITFYKNFEGLFAKNKEKNIIAMNDADLLNTYLINPALGQIPLFCYFEDENSISSKDAVFSVSFKQNDVVRWLQYFDDDAKRIFDFIIKPILEEDKKANVRKISYQSILNLSLGKTGS